jgi:hypothetical protein
MRPKNIRSKNGTEEKEKSTSTKEADENQDEYQPENYGDYWCVHYPGDAAPWIAHTFPIKQPQSFDNLLKGNDRF